MAVAAEFRCHRSGCVVRTAPSPRDAGGEGGVFDILGDPTRLAKVYATPCRLDDDRGRRAVALSERDDGSPHLVRVEDVLVSVGDPGLVCGCLLRKVPGHTLFSVTNPVERDLLKIALSLPDRVRVALEVARAVTAAHDVETVLADLHARNVIVLFDRRKQVSAAVLIDAEAWLFEWRDEVGRMERFVTTTLLPDAMAPELHGVDLTRTRPDKRSDVYSLALLLSSALFDCLPQSFTGSKLSAVERIVGGYEWITPRLPAGSAPPSDLPVEPALVPGEMMALLRRALSSTPDGRPTAGEFVAAFDAWYQRVSHDAAAARFVLALTALWKARSIVAVFGRAADLVLAGLRHFAPETAAKPARWWATLAVKCVGPVVVLVAAALWMGSGGLTPRGRSASPPPEPVPALKKPAPDTWRTLVRPNDPDPE